MVDDHHFMWSGLTDSSGQHGIALVIPKCLQGALVGLKPINDPALMVHFQHRLGKSIVTIAYAPTDVVDEHMKDEYYSLLQSVLEDVSPPDISIILMDVNAKIASVSHDPQL